MSNRKLISGTYLSPALAQTITVTFKPSREPTIPFHESGLIGFLTEVYPPNAAANACAAGLGPKLFRAVIDIEAFKCTSLPPSFFSELQAFGRTVV